MKINKAELLATVVRKDQYPPEGPPEIAFAGRSNVGKSSLLNLMTNRRRLARTSGSPGKTRTINFYAINGDEFRIVDLPGYGYARVSKSISETWGGMVESYLGGRSTLKAVCILVDIRHEPTIKDMQLMDYLVLMRMPILIVATKSDKLSANGRAKQLAVIRRALGVEKVVCVSALKRTGVEELLGAMAGYVAEGG
ncbi:MAG: ribosome biogenesis GTP-binding protein YihA/YsxC [Clostridiales bacterium]|nr:ribosome biogenesis GTP-binding protein YihA/YsxC [Clostridiales bacterium]